MFYRIFADAVLVFHFAFILFAVAGGLLALRWRWIPVMHVPAVLWGVYIEISGDVCPLTPLESSLREAAGSSGYSVSFIEHHILPVVYPTALDPSIRLVLVTLLLLTNVAAYSLVLRRRCRGAHRSLTRPC